MSAIYHESGVPSFFAPAPSFDFFEQAIQGRIVNFEVFDTLGGGFYEYKKMFAEIYAPGWTDGYDDDEVIRCPLIARKFRYQFAGIRW